MLHDRKSRSVWLVAGLGLGALAGILLAPQSGRETRKAIAARVDDGIEHMASAGRQARKQINNIVGSGKKALARKKEQVSAAVDKVKVLLKKAA
jgi:gas vesicle protein